MSGADIAKKVRDGLRKAVAATGKSSHSVKLHEYSVVSDEINGDKVTALPPKTLTNAIAQYVDSALVDGTTIKSGDIKIIWSGDFKVYIGAEVSVNGRMYKIVEPAIYVEPAGVLLSQKLTARPL